MTVKSGVEITVKKRAPQIVSVIDISYQELKEEQ